MRYVNRWDIPPLMPLVSYASHNQTDPYSEMYKSRTHPLLLQIIVWPIFTEENSFLNNTMIKYGYQFQQHHIRLYWSVHNIWWYVTIAQLLMLWFFASPGHQQVWLWQHLSIEKGVFSSRGYLIQNDTEFASFSPSIIFLEILNVYMHY